MASDALDYDVETLLDNPGSLFAEFFSMETGEKFELAEGQEDIARAIIKGEAKRVSIRTYTRYGKSDTVAMSAIWRAVHVPGEKVRIIAPTGDLTDIIMGYVRQHIFDSPYLIQQLSVYAESSDYVRKGVRRLKDKLSHSHITFKNGSEIMAFSADIIHQGRRMVGTGGTLVIVDECENIPPEIIRTKILRMLGDRPEEGVLILISNPVKRGFMYKQYKMGSKSRYKDFCIDWRQGIREGRTTQDHIDEMREEMTADEFRIWFEAMWAEEDVTAVWSEKCIEDMVARYKALTDTGLLLKMLEDGTAEILCKRLGCDVATRGADKAVLISELHLQFYERDGSTTEMFMVDEIREFAKLDTVALAGEIKRWDNEVDFDLIGIDYTGNGEGVVDILLRDENMRGKIDGIISAHAATGFSPMGIENKKIFVNRKGQDWRDMRKLADHGKMAIPNHPGLLDDLRGLQWQTREMDGRRRVVDPDDTAYKSLEGLGGRASPDHGDAWRYATAAKPHATLDIRGVKK